MKRRIAYVLAAAAVALGLATGLVSGYPGTSASETARSPFGPMTEKSSDEAVAGIRIKDAGTEVAI